MKVWDVEKVRAFLDSVAGDRLHAVWLLMATTGMRRGEVLGLLAAAVAALNGRRRKTLGGRSRVREFLQSAQALGVATAP
jgi:integrase